jgi:hypothetical protein
VPDALKALERQQLGAQNVLIPARLYYAVRHYVSVTKPQLPKCSVQNCPNAAGAIIGEAILCGEHACAALKTLRKAPCGNSVGEQR